MDTDFYSQLFFRLSALEERIEETMYFSLASSAIDEAIKLNELSLPNFLLAEVRQVISSPLYLTYNDNTKQKVLSNFPQYANSYSLIKLTASWEEFMLECTMVMEMAKTDDYGLRNQTILRESLRKAGNKNGISLLKDLDKLYQLSFVESVQFEVIRSMYKLRDCIAHRDGVISRWDLDKNNDFMSTVWKKAVVKKNNRIVSAWKLAGKAKFSTVLEDKRKQWVKDQVIVLEDIEICDIGLSLLEIGSIVFQKLLDYGRAHQFR